MRFRSVLTMAVAAMALFHVAAAEAQLNNRPFSFGGGGGGGIGISTAGRQALLNQQLFGSTPDNIFRSRFGTLLNVTRGDNGLAVVTTQGGAIIPQFRGRNQRRGGLFFESTSIGSGNGGAILLGRGGSSGITISAWTFSLVVASGGGGYPTFGGGYGFGGSGGSINSWTNQVAALGYR